MTIVVIDVLFPLKLAAILKTCVSVSAPLQQIEKASFNRIGVVLLTFLFSLYRTNILVLLTS
jgi:hypothetical protein